MKRIYLHITAPLSHRSNFSLKQRIIKFEELNFELAVPGEGSEWRLSTKRKKLIQSNY